MVYLLIVGNPDFVLDCIDNLDTKAELIAYCCKNKIRVIASMGAGAKADPSRVQIADISETFEDPLAKYEICPLTTGGREMH